VKHRSWFGNKNFGVQFAALSFAAGLNHAEEKPGTVRGAVVTIDLDGAKSVIPAAAVTIDNTELSRTATADEQGSFKFRDLPPGRSKLFGNSAVVLTTRVCADKDYFISHFERNLDAYTKHSFVGSCFTIQTLRSGRRL
jgi:hypothetical protein